jgi:hypothetical protein
MFGRIDCIKVFKKTSFWIEISLRNKTF